MMTEGRIRCKGKKGGVMLEDLSDCETASAKPQATEGAVQLRIMSGQRGVLLEVLSNHETASAKLSYNLLPHCSRWLIDGCSSRGECRKYSRWMRKLVDVEIYIPPTALLRHQISTVHPTTTTADWTMLLSVFRNMLTGLSNSHRIQGHLPPAPIWQAFALSQRFVAIPTMKRLGSDFHIFRGVPLLLCGLFSTLYWGIISLGGTCFPREKLESQWQSCPAAWRNRTSRIHFQYVMSSLHVQEGAKVRGRWLPVILRGR